MPAVSPAKAGTVHTSAAERAVRRESLFRRRTTERQNPDIYKPHQLRSSGTAAEGAERETWWNTVILVDQPIQAVYQDRTSRLIPVVVMDIIKD